MELSSPKQSQAIWWTSFEPNLVWGNQEPMWRIKPETLSAVATPRVEELALPKIDYSFPRMFIPQHMYGCGRVSQIWTVSPHALRGRATRRVRELARHKSAPPRYLAQHIPHYEYGCGRESAIWELGPHTLSCPNRPRTAMLAVPKQPHPDYRPCKPPQSIVTEEARLYTITPYLEELAKPKVHSDGPFRDAEWKVSENAKQCIAGERLVELARAKKPSEGYQPSRGPIWKVGMGALNAVASNRMEELSKPIIRDTMDSVQFNPGVFSVSEAAKKAKASARIEELAQPITRGK